MSICTFLPISLISKSGTNVSFINNLHWVSKRYTKNILGLRFVSKCEKNHNKRTREISCQCECNRQRCDTCNIKGYHNYSTIQNTINLNHVYFTRKIPCRNVINQFSGRCRSYSSQSNSSKKQKFDPKKLLWATYVSMGIGGCIFLAIIKREVDKVRNRLKGIEEVVDPIFGRRPLMVKYKDVMLPIFTSRILKDLEDFEVREDDVWVVSYPRSGTTWLQEIVYLIKTNSDFTTAKKKNIEDRFPYLEYYYPGLKVIDAMPSPRLIKTHLPLRLLPNDIQVKNPKIIYIVRNPKDVLVSYYHFTKMLTPITRFNGKFEDFYNRFLNNKVSYSPWWRHVKEFWDIKEQQNILIISYEDMQKDIKSIINTVADFLGKPLSEQEVHKIAEHCQFGNMKNNETLNFSWWTESGVRDKNESEFLRKGKVGDWKNMLTDEMNKRIDRMVIMKFYGSGLDFQYDLEHDNNADVST